MKEVTARRLLALLVTAFVGLGVTYALVTPCFESPDEWSHLSLVRYVGAHRALPPRVLPSRRALTGPDMAWCLGYHDPPLYYAPPLYHSLAALLTSSSWTNMDDLPYLLVPSPSWEAGWVPRPDGDPWNKNIYAHRAEETLARSGTVRAAYLLRLVSLGMGAVTVLCTYALARLLWPKRPFLALGAAAFVVLNPKFIVVSAGVTNDNLLNALFGLSLVCALRCMRDGAAWNRWAMLGGLVGLGLLTKQSAMLLLPLGLLAVLWQRGDAFLALPSRGGRRRKVLADGGAFLAAALGVGGWWYVRNAVLYSDPLGLEPHFASQIPLTHFGLDEALKTVRSYWASFGWAPMLVEPPVYAVAGLVMLVALAGIVAAVRPGGPLPLHGGDRGGGLWHAPKMTRRGLALLALALVLNAIGFVRWATATRAPCGRLLFPTLPVVGVLSAWGLSQWTRWTAVRWGLGGVVGLAFLFTAVVPWRYLRPAYATPRLPGGIPATAQPVGLAFQGGVRFAGYEPITGDLEPGEELRLTLYWHALAAPKRRYWVWVQLGPHDPTRKVAEHDVWLGGTLYPSELWQADDTVRQVYGLSIPDWAPAPGLYWFRVGLVDESGRHIPLADGSSEMAVLGPWRMRGVPVSPSPACAADFRLGTAIRLLGYDLDQQQGAGDVSPPVGEAEGDMTSPPVGEAEGDVTFPLVGGIEGAMASPLVGGIEGGTTSPLVGGIEGGTEEVLQLTLYWQAERVPPGDYTVYVHLLDAEGRLLSQHDGPPRDGAYPTSWWLPGELVLDQHVIRLDGATTGSARLQVGMYDPATLVRLPVYDGMGQRLPEDTISLMCAGGSDS